MLLQDEIVSGRDCVVFVGFEALTGIIDVDFVLLKLLQDIYVNRGSVDTDLSARHLR